MLVQTDVVDPAGAIILSAWSMRMCVSVYAYVHVRVGVHVGVGVSRVCGVMSE